MRIAHIGVGSFPPVYSPLGGAIQRRIAELARAQSRQGHHVTVFSPGSETSSAWYDDVDVQFLRVRTGQPLVQLEFQGRAISALRKSARTFDVIHFHSQPEGAVAGHWVAGVKILSYDNFYFRRTTAALLPVYRRALETFDALLPCSDYCLKESFAYWRLSPNRGRVLYNGVNLEQFRMDPAAAAIERQALDIRGPVVLYLGRVCTQKGTDTLLRAYSLLQETRPDVQLVIAGPIGQFGPRPDVRPDEDWIRKMRSVGAIYLDVAPDMRLTGLLNLADVFVMPTRELEMFGMAAVEAQACGTPVVASDHGGLKETVPAEVGLRFSPGDASGLAAALLTLVNADELRARLGRQAQEHARKFSWDKIALTAGQIYNNAIETPRRSR
jgi:D-inositol-3-phosphate glycosyltransferase